MSESPKNTDADRRLQDTLKSLPRAQASVDFTDRVLADLARQPASQHASRPWLMAAAVLLVASFFAIREWNHSQERRQSLERIAALQAEYMLLESELETMRQHADLARPVVYLGGDEQVDVVLDLARLAARKRMDIAPAEFNDRLQWTPGGRPAAQPVRQRTVQTY